MTIPIKPEIEKSLKKYAEETGQSIDEVANDILQQAMHCYENNPGHVAETLARWDNYQAAGKSISHEDVKKHMRSRKK